MPVLLESSLRGLSVELLDEKVSLGRGVVEALRGPQVGCVGVVHESGQVKAWWGSAPGHTPGTQDKAWLEKDAQALVDI